MGSTRAATFVVLLASAFVVAGLAASTLLGLPGAAQAQDPEDPPYELPTPTPSPTPTPTAAPLRLLTPSPVIGIRGKLTLNGARLTALRVTTPPLARVFVRCKGGAKKGCPVASSSVVVPDATTRTVRYRLKRFERTYRAGAVLELGVARRGTVGRFSRFTIRKGRFPRRRDACMEYGKLLPRECPGD